MSSRPRQQRAFSAPGSRRTLKEHRTSDPGIAAIASLVCGLMAASGTLYLATKSVVVTSLVSCLAFVVAGCLAYFKNGR
jgi:hypothetical protein